jgi:hypothetical protein
MKPFFFKRKLPLFLVISATIVALTAGSAVYASATTDTTEETATSSVTLAGITMRENTSYSSDQYFGVIHLIVGDDTVAQASLDSENRVVITAVGNGSTKVSYWYKATSSDGWTSATIAVTVSGTASSTVGGGINTGICFSQSSLSVSVSASALMNSITENGQAMQPNALLWVSSDPNVASVDSVTGQIKGVMPGSVTVYALDPKTKNCNGFTVQVTA